MRRIVATTLAGVRALSDGARENGLSLIGTLNLGNADGSRFRRPYSKFGALSRGGTDSIDFDGNNRNHLLSLGNGALPLGLGLTIHRSRSAIPLNFGSVRVTNQGTFQTGGAGLLTNLDALNAGNGGRLFVNDYRPNAGALTNSATRSAKSGGIVSISVAFENRISGTVAIEIAALNPLVYYPTNLTPRAPCGAPLLRWSMPNLSQTDKEPGHVLPVDQLPARINQQTARTAAHAVGLGGTHLPKSGV